jgi:predicted Rossmann-fold nucleotide-binding protein
MPNSLSHDTRLPRFGIVAPLCSPLDDAAPQRCWELGMAIASAGCVLLTRTCAGLTQAVVLGARSAGGHVVGISPAASLEEHAEVYAAPWRDYDLLIFTGAGTAPHERIHLRNSDIVLLTDGATVAFDELALAAGYGKLLGVLGSSRRPAALPESADFIQDDDPERLVAQLLWRFVSERSATSNRGRHPAVEVCS